MEFGARDADAMIWNLFNNEMTNYMNNFPFKTSSRLILSKSFAQYISHALNARIHVKYVHVFGFPSFTLVFSSPFPFSLTFLSLPPVISLSPASFIPFSVFPSYFQTVSRWNRFVFNWLRFLGLGTVRDTLQSTSISVPKSCIQSSPWLAGNISLHNSRYELTSI
jgi:hypothetical protein